MTFLVNNQQIFNNFQIIGAERGLGKIWGEGIPSMGWAGIFILFRVIPFQITFPFTSAGLIVFCSFSDHICLLALPITFSPFFPITPSCHPSDHFPSPFQTLSLSQPRILEMDELNGSVPN